MNIFQIKQFYIIVIVLSPFFLIAQDFSNYKPLVSKAPIPEEFIVSSTEKYQQDREAISSGRHKIQDEFYLKNNFVIDDLLRSGTVLFNDPISNYINKVADELLSNDPDLRSKLRFYTIKSHIPNAFATDRGSVFVTMGLMARLNNEAELAYILSHEIVHFVKKHSLNSYVKFEAQKSKPWKQESYYKKLVEKNNYSKELELEADELGFSYFKNSKYSYKSIVGVFDVLAFAHTAYGNIPFEKEFLEKKHFKLNDEYLLEDISTIEALEDNDENSTHPAISERKDKLQISLSKKSEKGRSTYIIGQQIFNQVKKMAKFEVCDILIQNRSYQAAIYHAFLLSKEYSNSAFPQKILTYSLYGLAQYRNEGRESEVEYYNADIPGEMRQAYYIIEKLSDKNLSILAALHTWEYYMNNPKDKMYKKMTVDMIEDLVIYQIEEPENYFLASVENKDTSDTENLFIGAFTNWMSNKELLNIFKQGEKYRIKIEQNKAFHETKVGNKHLMDYQKHVHEKGKALGLDTVVFVNPFYITVQGGSIKNAKINYIKSEKRQEGFEEAITKGGKNLGLQTYILDIKSMTTETDITKYHDIVMINKWVKNMMNHSMEIVDYSYKDISPLTKKYNTTSFAFTGALSLKNTGTIVRSYRVMFGLVFLLPPATPYAIEFLTSWFGTSYFFTIVYDLEQNRATLEYFNEMDISDRDAVLKANIFWAMQQMKNRVKAKKKTK